MKLHENKKNRFGDIQYIESDTGEFEWNILNPNNTWSIKNPSEEICKFVYENNMGILRSYDETNYLLSNKATQMIKLPCNVSGSACIITFEYQEKHYCLLNSDNKSYIQNVQGMSENEETPLETIVRETYEETKISLNDEKIVEIGYWTFISTNNLVEWSWEAKTILFHIHLMWNKVQHLFPNGIKENELTIVSANSYTFDLDETKFIIAFPIEMIDKLPKQIDEIKIKKKVKNNFMDHPIDFTGHHREAIRLLLGRKPKYDTSYLSTFCVNKLEN